MLHLQALLPPDPMHAVAAAAAVGAPAASSSHALAAAGSAWLPALLLLGGGDAGAVRLLRNGSRGVAPDADADADDSSCDDDDDDDSDGLSSALGFVMAVVGAASGSIGLLLIKSGAILEAKKPWFRRRRWLFGFFMQAGVAAMTDTVAFATAPLSLLAPLAGVTLGLSTVWSGTGCITLIHEPLSCGELLCLLLIFMGVTLSSVFGPTETENDDLDKLGSYFAQGGFLAYWIVSSLAMITWTTIVNSPSLRESYLPASEFARTFISAITAASASGLTQVFLKIVAELIPYISDHHRVPTENGWIYFAFIFLGIFAITQLYMIDLCVGFGRATLAVPIFTSLSVVLTSAGSALFFGDFDCMSSSDLLAYFCGSAVVICGILLLPYIQNLGIGLEAEAGVGAGDLPREPSCCRFHFWVRRFWLVAHDPVKHSIPDDDDDAADGDGFCEHCCCCCVCCIGGGGRGGEGGAAATKGGSADGDAEADAARRKDS